MGGHQRRRSLQRRGQDHAGLDAAVASQHAELSEPRGLVPTQLRHVKALLVTGSRSGEISLEGSSADIRARCVLEAIWGAGAPVALVGQSAAHSLARDTVLRGAAVRS